jgi:hypothetical protein
MDCLRRGNELRVVAAMKMNARSSRSHALFVLELHDVSSGQDSGGAESGKLSLVDLAGMESSKKSYYVESVRGPSSAPQRREEARNINTSLFALGTVIERLAATSRALHGQGAAHVPYRDSKLTRLLQESLGGNTASAVVVTLRTESANLDETIGTLRFAVRAKAVSVVVRPHSFLGRLDASHLESELAFAREGERGAAADRSAQEGGTCAGWPGSGPPEPHTASGERTRRWADGSAHRRARSREHDAAQPQPHAPGHHRVATPHARDSRGTGECR